MALQFIGTYSFAQIGQPQWSKDYYGADECAIAVQGAAYLEKSYLDGLTAFQAMSWKDSSNNSYSDAGMRLVKFTSDEDKVIPTVTLSYKGCRGASAPPTEATDSFTIQTATTVKQITDSTSDNYKASITCTYTYRSARTTYKWVALSTPPSSSPYNTVRNAVDPLGSAQLVRAVFSGMNTDPDGITYPLTLADATAVLNTFTRQQVVSDYEVHDAIPSYLWECSAVVDYTLAGSST